MKGNEFQQALAKFRAQWPNGMSEIRESVLWSAWETLPDGVFHDAMVDLIYKGGYSPSGEDIDFAINFRLRKHREELQKTGMALEGCELCSCTGMIQLSHPTRGNAIGRCDCKLGQSYEGKLNCAMMLMQAGYARKERKSAALKAHPDYKAADEGRFGPQLCALYNTIQRAILLKESTGLSAMLAHFAISKAEAWEVYKDMRAGSMSARVRMLKNRAVLRTVLALGAKDAPTEGAVQ